MICCFSMDAFWRDCLVWWIAEAKRFGFVDSKKSGNLRSKTQSNSNSEFWRVVRTLQFTSEKRANKSLNTISGLGKIDAAVSKTPSNNSHHLFRWQQSTKMPQMVPKSPEEGNRVSCSEERRAWRVFGFGLFWWSCWENCCQSCRLKANGGKESSGFDDDDDDEEEEEEEEGDGTRREWSWIKRMLE